MRSVRMRTMVVRVPWPLHLFLDTTEDCFDTLRREALEVINQANCLVGNATAEGGYIARALANKVLKGRWGGGGISAGLGVMLSVSTTISSTITTGSMRATMRTTWT